jgi:hypothetical protein
VPVEVKGLVETKKAMRQFTPDLLKEMNDEIKKVMTVVRDDARDYVPFTVVSGWTHQRGTWANRAWSTSEVKKGIVYSQGRSEANQNGFRSYYRVINKTPAGAIFETAGRKNPQGQPWAGKKKSGNKKFSHSSNPNAGRQFINSLQGSLVGQDKDRGRLVYRAWAEDNGKVIPAGLEAINKARTKFNKRAQPK